MLLREKKSAGRKPGDQVRFLFMIPKKWVKFIVALFLLPAVFLLTGVCWGMGHEALQQGLFFRKAFLLFVAGGVLFGLFFLLLPRHWLFLPYVYGHECTHALWVKIFGGEVEERFLVSRQGGHILANRVNTWIMLAPYFFPIYSVLLLSIDGMAHLLVDLSQCAGWNEIFLMLLGFSWVFHLTFTVLLIAEGQPDLHYGGTFFSLLFIYSINLLLLLGLLAALFPHFSWGSCWQKGMESFLLLQWLLRQFLELLQEGGQFLLALIKMCCSFKGT